MAMIAFPGQVSLFAVLGESARRYRARHTLTAQERVNLRASCGRQAVFTASLGGHTTY
ncbi:hypothetical protein [Nocardia panacis]|uniref:hypothetical protein n=1 Tax=Nocardia panacis TaxID=2340916 RepID=UPI0013159423|nr:hypothetical protein [Nocardia panacis]